MEFSPSCTSSPFGSNITVITPFSNTFPQPTPTLWVTGQLSRRPSYKKRPARSWNVSASQGILSCFLSVKFQSQKPGQKSKRGLDERYMPGSIPWKGQERDFSSLLPPNRLRGPNQPSIKYTPALFPSRDMKLTTQLQLLLTLIIHGLHSPIQVHDTVLINLYLN